MFGITSRTDFSRLPLSERLDSIERRAISEPTYLQARLFNQAGHLCLRERDKHRAKIFFGRAIDAYLEGGQFECAAAVCRKLIRVAPEVIRARATLAVLYLGRKIVDSAVYEIELVEDYIRVAREAGDEQLLIYRLRVMAEATGNQELRVLIGQRLLELGDAECGMEILHGIYREINGLAAQAEPEPAEQWARLIAAAMMTPDDLVRSAHGRVAG